MASAALFETAVRHRHLTIDTGIDAVRATQAAVATTAAREGRAVDTQRRTGIVGGQYALLAPPEQDVSSEEHTSELQSLMRISHAVFFLRKQSRARPVYQTKSTKENTNEYK